MRRLLLPVVGALIAAAMVWLGVVQPLQLDRLKKPMLEATQLASANVGSPASRRMARVNLDNMEPAAAKYDADAELLTLAAANAYMVNDRERAVALYARAVAVEGRPELFTYLGSVEAELGRNDEAVESYAHAVAFAPSFIDRAEIAPLRTQVLARAAQLRRAPFPR